MDLTTLHVDAALHYALGPSPNYNIISTAYKLGGSKNVEVYWN